MRMHAEDARRNGWTGRDGLREGGQRGKGEGGRVGGAGREKDEILIPTLRDSDSDPSK